MGKRCKRNPESVKRRTKARRLKKKLALSSQTSSSSSLCAVDVCESSDAASSVASFSGNSVSTEKEVEAECKAATQQEVNIEVSQKNNTNTPRKLIRNELHKVLVTSRWDPLIIGLQMMNDLELRKRILSRNTNIFHDPNQPRNKPF